MIRCQRLLLARENTMRMNHIRVFQYDPGTGSVIQPPQVLAETNVLIAMAADGNGILDTNISIGTGDTEIDRVTLSGGSLIWETQWNGRMDQVPEELGAVEITWYDVNDLTALEEQLSAASGSSGGGEVILPSSEPVPEFTPSEPWGLRRRRCRWMEAGLCLPERSIRIPIVKCLLCRESRIPIPARIREKPIV